jgi:mannose-1-phosphate guanylyltransferase
VEKPSRGVAGKLIEEGGLWNSGIFAANGTALMDRFKYRFMGNAMNIMCAVAKSDDPMNPLWALSHLYERISDVDFSHHVLQPGASDLRMVRVPACGWSDLGTLNRVVERVNLLSDTPLHSKPHRDVEHAFLSLAEAVYRTDQRCVSARIH